VLSYFPSVLIESRSQLLISARMSANFLSATLTATAAAKPAFSLKWPCELQCFFESCHHAAEIVWVNRDLPAPIQCLFRR